MSLLLMGFLYCSSTVSIFLSILNHYKEPNEPLQTLIGPNKAEETCHRIQVIEVIEVLQWLILKNRPYFGLKGERTKTSAHTHLNCLISLFYRKLWMCWKRRWWQKCGFQAHTCKHTYTQENANPTQSRRKLPQVCHASIVGSHAAKLNV